ncbi:MAG: YbjN domain-containing protein [Clostridia bacterium]|nr:YbjN domain-containing protein [Clostridia bacterium]
MADERAVRQAKVTYDTLCRMLDEINWRYERDEENFTIDSGSSGEDLPIQFRIIVDPERMIVSLISPLPFDIPDEKRVEMAIAVSMVNYSIVDGSFDYDYTDGTLLFRMTSSFRESLIGKDVFKYMIAVSCKTIDDYNDKFLMIVKDVMSLVDLFKFIEEE